MDRSRGLRGGSGERLQQATALLATAPTLTINFRLKFATILTMTITNKNKLYPPRISLQIYVNIMEWATFFVRKY
jgi:hypothetical protein